MADDKGLDTSIEQLRAYLRRAGWTITLGSVELALANMELAGIRAPVGWQPRAKFKFGDRVTKTKGSSWTGRVVGVYETGLTPIGYCVESENEPGSVQIYPEAALSPAPTAGQHTGEDE